MARWLQVERRSPGEWSFGLRGSDGHLVESGHLNDVEGALVVTESGWDTYGITAMMLVRLYPTDPVIVHELNWWERSADDERIACQVEIERRSRVMAADVGGFAR